ncbi:tetratricopeptide repeat protein [Rickettsiales bacterium]|nr:tetratricopeptide repeat protein [Rickettsiales bacterium]
MVSTKSYIVVRSFIVFVTFLISFGVGNSSFADLSKKDEFEKTFQQMLKDPANIDISLRYAKLASDMGDYESAIPALERILMFNPKLSQVKLELGILYYRLKSFDMAKAYLEGAKKGDADKDIIDRANKYLDKI